MKHNKYLDLSSVVSIFYFYVDGGNPVFYLFVLAVIEEMYILDIISLVHNFFINSNLIVLIKVYVVYESYQDLYLFVQPYAFEHF